VEESSVLTVQAYVDVADPSKTEWVARVMAPAGAPFAGLFAFGPNFADARQALAGVVWTAVKSGAEGIKAEGVDAVRVLALTRKTFATADLGQEGA
jgi:hypothetical protein